MKTAEISNWASVAQQEHDSNITVQAKALVQANFAQERQIARAA